jgi:hypothetical protein
MTSFGGRVYAEFKVDQRLYEYVALLRPLPELR